MSESNFKRCPRCREYAFLDSHRCAPAWECRFAKGGCVWADGTEEWENVHAYDAETAAEKFCERTDCNGGDYVVVQSGEAHPALVEVRAVGADDIQRFSVFGETQPVYHGRSVAS